MDKWLIKSKPERETKPRACQQNSDIHYADTDSSNSNSVKVSTICSRLIVPDEEDNITGVDNTQLDAGAKFIEPSTDKTTTAEEQKLHNMNLICSLEESDEENPDLIQGREGSSCCVVPNSRKKKRNGCPPKRPQKFCDAWLKIEKFSSWLAKAENAANGKETAHCKLCNSYIIADKNDINRHSESFKHKLNLKKLKILKLWKRCILLVPNKKSKMQN